MTLDYTLAKKGGKVWWLGFARFWRKSNNPPINFYFYYFPSKIRKSERRKMSLVKWLLLISILELLGERAIKNEIILQASSLDRKIV